MSAQAANIAAAVQAGNDVLRGRGDRTYLEALDAIRLLVAALDAADVAAKRIQLLEQQVAELSDALLEAAMICARWSTPSALGQLQRAGA